MKKFACLALVVAACGSKSTAPATTTPKEEPATVVLPDVPFEQLDHEQRAEFMKQKVVPAMEPIFKNHDAKKYAEFGCVTCHGPGAMKGEFHMPAADGPPKLTKEGMGKISKEDMEWMAGEVKPLMAKLLGESEWSPENPTGFGCHDCHTTEQP